MASHEENNSLAISYMTQKHSRCCCDRPEDIDPNCIRCKPTTQICCLLATHSLWVKQFVFVRLYDGPAFGEEGDPCSEKGATNLCGEMYAVWPGGSAPCMPLFRLEWVVSNDCQWVGMKIGNSSALSTLETLPRDWYTGPVVIDGVPGGGTITLTECPTSWPEAFTEAERTTAIQLEGYLQGKDGSVWNTRTDRVTAAGVCICGNPIFCPGVDPFLESRRHRIYWRYDLYLDKTVVWVELSSVEVARKEFDGSGCEWADSPFYVYSTTQPTLFRWYIEKVTDCLDTGGGPPDPCDPGCWPECAMCPNPKSMAAVFTPDPSCCASGSVGLTYEEANNRWALASPHSFGPTCSTLLFFRMTCSGETSVTFNWKYRNTNGDEIERTDTVAVTCSEDGDFETASVSIATNLITPGLCTTGTGKGANVRVISV